MARARLTRNGGGTFEGADAQEAREAELVAAPGTPAPDGRELGDHSWTRVRFDVVLAPAGA